ncbi:hypothetical protein HN51_070326 [Arachis hypogaea]
MPKSFKDECFDSMIKELCMKNKENRSKQTIPHTCGSKSNSRRRHEMYLETEKKPSREMMYIETHKRKDGSFVNNEALTIVEQIELNMTQSNAIPNDEGRRNSRNTYQLLFYPREEAIAIYHSFSQNKSASQKG